MPGVISNLLCWWFAMGLIASWWLDWLSYRSPVEGYQPRVSVVWAAHNYWLALVCALIPHQVLMQH